MGEWSNLTQREKSNIIRFAIKNGVSDINQIRDTFNVYAKDSLANVDYDMAAAKASGFGSNGNGHYPDTFKKPNHPTFSDESIYNSEATPGGHWSERNSLQRWNFSPSAQQIAQPGYIQKAIDYLNNNESEGVTLTDSQGRYPSINGTIYGGVLPEIEIKPSPKYKKSSEAYYDPETDTVFAPDSTGEFYTHERFHARPNKEYLQKIAPYYENLNDSVLTSMGADLPFINRNGDPGQYYSPEEIGARVAASLGMLKKAGVSKIDSDFVKESRKNELKYGDNYRDLLHMYNDDIITNLLNSYAKGGSIRIAPSKRGTFTAAATKHGKSVQEFARQVLNNKENYSSAMVRKAVFAHNSAKWHKHDGLSDTQYLSTDAIRNYTPQLVEPAQMSPDYYAQVQHEQNLINQGVIRDADIQRARESGFSLPNIKESSRAKEIQRNLDTRGNVVLRDNTAKAFNGILGMSMPSTYYNLFNLENPLSSEQALALDLGTAFAIGIAAKGIQTAGNLITKYPGIRQRTIEGLMRQSGSQVPDIKQYISLLKTNKDARKYILTGQLSEGQTPVSIFGPYQGLFGDVEIPYNRDYISALLYGTDLDDRIATKIAVGKDFGPALEKYIGINYADKASRIPVYQLKNPHMGTQLVPKEQIKNIKNIQSGDYLFGRSMDDAFIPDDLPGYINVGGYSNNIGVLNGTKVIQGTDIYKFNSGDYTKKWLTGMGGVPPILRPFYKLGVNFIDKHTIPVVTKTAWGKVPILSTGGPLYPFSFQKNPYWKTPVVRYNDGGEIRNWDTTLTGKLINYVENSDSIGWNPVDRTWEHPTKPGYDKNQIGMGVDKNETPGYLDYIQYRPKTNIPFLTELDERLIRHNAIEAANKSANARYKFAQEAVNRPKGTVSPVKDAAVVSAIYNLGAGYVANGLFEDKDFMLKLFDGTDKEVVDRINQEYKKKNRNERIAKTNLFLFQK